MADPIDESIDRVISKYNVPVNSVDNVVSEALVNLKSNLPVEKLEEYMYALANKNIDLQLEINRVQARISILDQKIRALVRHLLDYKLVVKPEERLEIAAAKHPEAYELYKQKKSLERELTLVDFLTNKIEMKRKSYEASLYGRKK